MYAIIGVKIMTILDRIVKLRDERGWSNYRLAKEAQISESSLNNLFRLENLPTIPTLEAICKGFGISLAQFFAQDGEAVVLSKEQQEFLDAYATLSDAQRAALLALIKLI